MTKQMWLPIAGMLVVAACAKKDETPAAAAPQYQQTQYTQAPYPAQTAYPQPAQTAYPQATATAYPQPAPATTTTGTMATPNQFALSCQNDSGCGLGRCNLQYQKCAFPCQSAVDCVQGASCNPTLGVCLPGGGQ